MYNVKLARHGNHITLADFDTKFIKLFNSSGRFVSDGLLGTPTFMEVDFISLLQTTKGIELFTSSGLYRSSLDRSKLNSVIKELYSTGFLLVPFQLSGKTERGTSYIQYIFCYTKGKDVSSILNNLSL